MKKKRRNIADFYVEVNGEKVYITGTREDEKRSAPGILHGGGADGKWSSKSFLAQAVISILSSTRV